MIFLLVKPITFSPFYMVIYYLPLSYSPNSPHTFPLTHYVSATVVCFSHFFNKSRMSPSSESLHSTRIFSMRYQGRLSVFMTQFSCHNIKEKLMSMLQGRKSYTVIGPISQMGKQKAVCVRCETQWIEDVVHICKGILLGHERE